MHSPEQIASVVLGPDEYRVNGELLLVLERMHGIYQRGGQLVRIRRQPMAKKDFERPPEAPVICAVEKANLRTKLTQVCEFLGPVMRNGEPVLRKGEQLIVRKHPPDWAIEGLIASDEWPVPALEFIAESPMVLKGGRLLTKPGFDKESGIYVSMPDAAKAIPAVRDRPTKKDVDTAKAWILEPFVDFPFAKDCHRSSMLAGILTYFVRPAYYGNTPLFLLDGNTSRCGKTMLGEIAALICVGRKPTKLAQIMDENRLHRRITSIAVGGDPFVLIDNIKFPFGNGTIDKLLTDTEWSDTLLYSNVESRWPLFSTWWGSGVNVQFARGVDTAERCAHIRLESPLEKPQNRTGFRHPDVVQWSREHRHELVWAALTLLKGFYAAGAPDQGLVSWGGFAEWSAIVRNCLVWAGFADPYEARAEMTEDTDSTAALGGLLAGWQELCREAGAAEEGLTIRAAMAELECELEMRKERTGYTPRFDLLLNALSELVSSKGGRLPDVDAVKYVFRRYRNKVAGGLRMVNRCPDGKNRYWLVETLK